jgi:endonuclease G, mitochondrial
MISRNEITDRKYEVMKAAGRRWREKAGERERTAQRLAEGGPTAASSPSRSATFIARESMKAAMRFEGIGRERMIGPTLDLQDLPPNPTARKAGRPVVRIVELADAHTVGEGFATGFQIAHGLIMTNWHVFSTAADAVGCGAQFGFERNDSGLLEGGVVFELDPQLFFISNEALDIAIVGIKDVAAVGTGTLDDYGLTRLIPTQGKILVGHPISIIQHPDGRQKQWAVRQNKLTLDPQDEDLFISYTTDTLAGSSGSPAFNYDWELVAVHHSAVPRMENGKILTKTGGEWRKGMPDTDVDWVANEGARVSKIYALLKETKLPDANKQRMLDSLVANSKDPVLSGEIARPVNAGGNTADPSLTNLKGREASMNITINGTANFYIGTKDENRIAPAEKTRLLTDAIPVPSTAVEKKIKFDSDYAHRSGFNRTFLSGFDVPPPIAPLQEVLKSGNEAKVLKYHHYSLVMHKTRRLVMWAASNVDYDKNKRWRTREEFGTDSWKADPRIPEEQQIEDLEFYEPAAKFDRGHIVRREDVAWGKTKKEEEYGNSDSFHWTNCTPQNEGFNRAIFGYHGLWGELENHIATQAGFLKNVLIIFAGPVLDPNDPSRDFGSGIEVKVPIVFWKILVAVEEQNQNRNLRAYGFLLDQTDAINEYGWEAKFKAGKFKEQQVSLREITDRTRVQFDQVLHDADPMALEPHESRARSLNQLSDIKLR